MFMRYHCCMSATTIKVPQELRDRINQDARERGLTASALLEELVAAYERQQRLEAFGRAFAGRDTAYGAEADAWATGQTAWPRD